MSIYQELEKDVANYHKIIRKAFDQFWLNKLRKQIYDEKLFVQLFQAPRDIFFEYCNQNKLNYSSVAGTVQEWTLFHFLNAGLYYNKKNTIACVVNGQQIPFIWKKKGFEKVKIDLVIKNIVTNKLYYAFEIKTNFDDSFPKYLQEEKHIYHHRTKSYKDFKYYYLSLNPPSRGILKFYRKEITRLTRQEELYVISIDKSKLPSIKSFLKAVSNAINRIS